MKEKWNLNLSHEHDEYALCVSQQLNCEENSWQWPLIIVDKIIIFDQNNYIVITPDICIIIMAY